MEYNRQTLINAMQFNHLELKNLKFLSMRELTDVFDKGLSKREIVIWDDKPACGVSGVNRVSYKDSGHGVKELLELNPLLVIMDSYWDHDEKCTNKCCDNNEAAFIEFDKKLNTALYILPVGHPKINEHCLMMTHVALNLLTIKSHYSIKDFLFNAVNREGIILIMSKTGLALKDIQELRNYLTEEDLNRLSVDKLPLN